MKPKRPEIPGLRPRAPRGFTLLELVIVLAILAVVTSLAVRTVDRVEEQQRFEASQRGLEELESAILGTPAPGAPDPGSVSGFVADMGRLPRAAGDTVLGLRELLANPGAAFDARPAVEANGVSAAEADPQVLVPGGWRGPYLRLPIGGEQVLDGWGNPYVSPLNPSPPEPLTTGYARLRTAADTPITTAGEEIRILRHLGANGAFATSDSGYDRDVALVFSDDRFAASLKGTVEVRNGEFAAEADAADHVIVRVFSPDPDNAARIRVRSAIVSFATNPVIWEIPASAGLTIGPRVVRAYFEDVNSSGTTPARRSAARSVTLRPGVNPHDLVVDR